MNPCLKNKIYLSLILLLSICGCKPSDIFSAQNTNQASNTKGAVQKLDLLDQNLSPAYAEAACGLDIRGYDELSEPLKSLATSPAIVTPLNREDLRLATLSALSAVPGSLQRLFFKTNNGLILIGDEVQSCQTPQLSEEERNILKGKEIAVCWRAPDNKRSLQLILKPDALIIRQSLLRLFAYMYSEYFMERIQSNGLPPSFQSSAWQKLINSFKVSRDKLSNAYLNDLSSEKSQQFELMKKYKEKSPAAFGNMVFANVIDSYYCNQKTRAQLSKSFKSVYNTITDSSDPNSLIAIIGY